MNAKPSADSGIMANTSLPSCARMQNLSAEALTQVAAYFQALSEPARLRLLNLLRGSERSVGELAEATGYSAANVSRHLALLAQQRLPGGAGRRGGRASTAARRCRPRSAGTMSCCLRRRMPPHVRRLRECGTIRPSS